jgi:CheY-like chemotaxis protein
LAPENLDLNQHVMTVADLFRERLGEAIQIETKLQEGLWQCFADLAEVDSALLNLIVNARDAMKGGGKLTIETRNVVVDDFYAKAHDDHAEISLGEYVMIAVSDTGVGMSANVLGHAVEPFFTTKGALGTGLGLSQVHGFVKQSGGFLKIESELGQGTTIKIYLPRHLGEPASGDAAKFSAEQSISAREQNLLQRETVLVVEDDEQVREFSAAAVENLGYRVVVAENAASALRALADHPEIALLFTDLGLPDIDGYELAQEARRRVPALKVVYTTGYTPDTVARFRDIEPLAKPFKLEDLARKLQEALQKLII